MGKLRLARRTVVFCLFAIAGFAACNTGDLGSAEVTFNRGAGLMSGGGGGPREPIIGGTCKTGEPGKICLALKYVAFDDPAGNPAATEAQAIDDVKGINKVWAQCNLGFQIEEYDPLNPAAAGFRYSIANLSDLDPIRKAYLDDMAFLVVVTGPWDRTGTLGNTGANAWTSMPGAPPYGAIFEKPVATNPNIMAHELGHYLNLSHVSDASDVMNPVIYPTSTVLSATQCSTARDAATYFWGRMLR